MKRIWTMLLCLMLLIPPAAAAGDQPAYGLQDCHRTKLTETQLKQRSGATAYLWQIKTAQDAVDAELNAVTKAWAEEIGPTLPAPGSSNSRVNCIIKPSRTGLHWMSFMLQARTIVNVKTRQVRFTTRTYDMTTGERILLTDIFPADSEAWGMLAEAVRTQVGEYFPGTAPDAAALEAATTREALAQADFTLHGLSLVMHYHAADFYPGREQLIEVTLYYPDIRPMMTEKARAETDNLRYYKTVALTYDDGPNAWCTDQVLLTLMKKGERATFFLVGERVNQQAYLVQREHDEGHSIASHNYQHVYANTTPIGQLQAMPAKVDAAHVAAIGLPVRLARAPGGQWERMAEADMGWPLIMWSVDAADWMGEDGPDPRHTASNIAAGTQDGGIILMHDLKRNSIQASELLITRLQEEGYLFLTVEELFRKDEVPLVPNQPYWRCTDGYTLKELP